VGRLVEATLCSCITKRVIRVLPFCGDKPDDDD
jgi:hypothetical protein